MVPCFGRVSTIYNKVPFQKKVPLFLEKEPPEALLVGAPNLCVGRVSTIYNKVPFHKKMPLFLKKAPAGMMSPSQKTYGFRRFPLFLLL